MQSQGGEHVSEQVTITKEDVGTIEVKDKTPRLRTMFNELLAQKQALAAELKPSRDFHDKHVNDPKLLEARKKIKEINAKMAPIDQELAGLARAIGSKGAKIEAGVYETK